MDVKQKYIREAGYDVDEYFVEQLQHLDIRTGIKIAKFIEENIINIPYNSLVSTPLLILFYLIYSSSRWMTT